MCMFWYQNWNTKEESSLHTVFRQKMASLLHSFQRGYWIAGSCRWSYGDLWGYYWRKIQLMKCSHNCDLPIGNCILKGMIDKPFFQSWKIVVKDMNNIFSHLRRAFMLNKSWCCHKEVDSKASLYSWYYCPNCWEKMTCLCMNVLYCWKQIQSHKTYKYLR